MNYSTSLNKDLKFFVEFWNESCILTAYQVSWVKSQCKVVPIKRHQILSNTINKSHYFYFVSRGIVAHIEYLPTGKRKIINLASAGRALSTSVHLYSNKRISGDLVALRSGAVIAIPYSSVLACNSEDAAVNQLISKLTNQQLQLLHKLRVISWSLQPSERYHLFIKLLWEVAIQISQYEQADLLGISRSCIQQQKRKLLFLK